MGKSEVNALVFVDPEPRLPTIAKIVENLDRDRRLLSRHFPDLCRQIVLKRRSYQQVQRASVIRDRREEIQRVTLSLYTRGEYPSEARVSALLSRSSFLHYPRVRSVIRQARGHLGIEP